MIAFREISLPPTLFKVDVFFVNTKDETELARTDLSHIFADRYGEDHQYYYQELDVNSVMWLDANGKVKEKRIICLLDNKAKPNVIVHESFHILNYLCNLSGLDYNHQSQEWGACMIEYIFQQITDFNNARH